MKRVYLRSNAKDEFSKNLKLSNFNIMNNFDFDESVNMRHDSTACFP